MGRGKSGIKKENGVTVISAEKWGKPMESWGGRKDIKDENGDVIGYIEDVRVYNSVPDERKITKKEILDDIDGWRQNDGTPGGEDVSITIAYNDGTYYHTIDGAVEKLGNDYRDKYKKTGIIGASISTGDYEMVWGGERNRNGKFIEWKTWSDDGESGLTNSYSGYKQTLWRWERRKVTFNNVRKTYYGEAYYQKTTPIRYSTWVPVR